MKSRICHEAPTAETSDEMLVAASAHGDSAAFTEIVRRYQGLVCSLAYSATGSLHLSEDLAQETFLTAWKRMRHLEQPHKLRSWLGGIVRQLGRNTRRRLSHEPSHRSELLESKGEPLATDLIPAEQAIKRETESVVWAALEGIPVAYREPLILFYREHQSIASVAENLELSETTVRQRLSRGRKLLQEEVLSLIEGTLAQSAPGPVFTASVLAAMPLATLPGTTAAGMISSAKIGAVSSGLAKLAAGAGAVFGPLTGLVGAWAGYRAGLTATRTPAEAAYLKHATVRMLGASLALTGLILFLLLVLPQWWRIEPVTYVVLVTSAVLTNFVLLGIMIVRFRDHVGRLRVAERKAHPEAFLDEIPGRGEPKHFRSQVAFLGVPLVEVRYGVRHLERQRPAFAWFAFGDVAIGLIGAVGPVACAPLAFGAFAVGFGAIGGLSIAGFAIGAVAVGGFALGGLALGAVATGGIALGWTVAIAAVAVAREVAVGQVVHGAHANDAVATAWLAAHAWLDVRRPEVLLLLNLLWLPSVFITWMMIWRWHVTNPRRLAKPTAGS